MALQNPQLPPPMRMQLMMQLQVHNTAMQQMQMMMGGNAMMMMGGNGNNFNSGANTPNGSQQQTQQRPKQQQPTGLKRTPPLAPAAMAKRAEQPTPAVQPAATVGQVPSSENTGSKRKHEEISPENTSGKTAGDSAKTDEARAAKQVKTQ